ncbi:MAG TPA: DUF4954 family protein [Sediminispirochaeta sp.]|nr:DUF4954 family protein [Sediminispirochaeta sp.]
MENVKIIFHDNIGENFLPPEFIPEGEDEYYLRNRQNRQSSTARWRQLSSREIEILVSAGNSAEDWSRVLVKDEFDPNLIRHSSFYGLVRIGRLRKAVLRHHDLSLPTGIVGSMIVSSDIGDDCSIHNVHYLSHYIVEERCIISNVDEMSTTNHAKFGNGILKEGEPEKDRVWLDIMNETGSRQVMPFDGMLPADAYLWAKYRDDEALQRKLGELTQSRFDHHRGYYGVIGSQSVIKTSRILKDVKVGPHCYIKGANKLKNLTINSSPGEPSQIGEGVELVNGIIGYGCHVFYGCKAVRFILGDNSHLKYGARLINSFLGDNSTVSCCEVLNNLIFPAHEQHHNNSFLIASVVMGQSNMAAGATVGSNHNSRANDNEVVAGRGFWPGLASSIKHSSRFASYTLLAKGAYPAELNIPLPFSLLNNNESAGSLEVMPAFWWMHNMYALVRNSWKFKKRDIRDRKLQHIEFDYLAPDTVEEIVQARSLLALWTGKAALQGEASMEKKEEAEILEKGLQLLEGEAPLPQEMVILGENMEKSRRPVLLLKVKEAYSSYGQMLRYYAGKNLSRYLNENPDTPLNQVNRELGGQRATAWANLGGQLMKEEDLAILREEIGSGALTSWTEIHRRYDELWEKYSRDKLQHAYSIFQLIYKQQELDLSSLIRLLKDASEIQSFISEQVYRSRKKDHDNPFRRATYRSDAEMQAAIGTVEDNSFVHLVREETEQFQKTLSKLIDTYGGSIR